MHVKIDNSLHLHFINLNQTIKMKKIIYLFVASCFFFAVACGGGGETKQACTADCVKECCAAAETSTDEAPAETEATPKECCDGADENCCAGGEGEVEHEHEEGLDHHDH